MTQRYLPIIALLLPALWAGNAGAQDSGINVSEPPAIAGANPNMPAAQPVAPKASSSGFLKLPDNMPQGQAEAEPQPQAAPAKQAPAPQPAPAPAAGNNAFSLPDTTDNDTEAAEPSELPVGNPPAAEVPVKLPDTATSGTPPVPEGAAPPAPPPAEENQPEANTIALQGLNKVTGHISRIEAPIGTVMRFGNLEIIGRRCWKSPADEQPENAGLLEIWELKPGESHQRIFLGWMFASSPGLSGLEHPVYDVTMIECLHVDDSQKSTPAQEPENKGNDKPEAKPAAKPAKPAAKKAPAKTAN